MDFSLTRRSAFVRCCLQKRRVNPIKSAKPELHPASAGLEVLKGRQTIRVKVARVSGCLMPILPPLWGGFFFHRTRG